jgi:hypothetical protein
MKTKLCDNNSSMAKTIVHPGCISNPATKRIKITYNSSESDVLNLCPACAKAITKEARSHGYKVS